MPNTKKWTDLRSKIAPERRTRMERWVQRELAEMALAQIRESRGLTQEEVARRLEIGQPNVSKLEHRSNMTIAALREYISALGGELDITVHFPDRDVRLPLERV